MDHTLLGVVIALIVIGLALLNKVSAADSEEQQSGPRSSPALSATARVLTAKRLRRYDLSDHAPDHSAVIPVSLASFVHLARSAARYALNVSGALATISESANSGLDFTAVLFNTLLTSACRR